VFQSSNSHRLLFLQSFLSLVELFGHFLSSIGWFLFFDQCISDIRGTYEGVYWRLKSTVPLLFSSLLVVKRGLRLLSDLFLTCSLPYLSPWLRIAPGPCLKVFVCQGKGGAVLGSPWSASGALRLPLWEGLFDFLWGCSQGTKFVTFLTTNILCCTFLWQCQWGTIPWCVTKWALGWMVWLWST